MNILLYTKTSTYGVEQVGGAQTSIRLLGEHLAKKNHNVTYVTRTNKKNSVVRKFVSNGVGVHVYPRLGKLRNYAFVKLIFGSSAAKRRAKKMYHQYLISLLQQQEIQCVYLYYDLEAIEDFVELRKNKEFRIVMRMAGLNWYEESISDPTLKLRYEKAFASVDSINYNTPGLKALIYQRAKEINFSYSPRDEFVADVGASYLIPEDIGPGYSPKSNKMSVLIATRFSKYQKRQDLIVKALSISERTEEMEVLMIGSGPNKENIEELIKGNGLEETIKVLPFLSQQELWCFLSNADVLCHPCEYEGLSKIMVESMMMGIPVMASKVVPLDDYVNHEVTGFLVENTPEAWKAAFHYVLDNRKSLEAIGAAGKEFSVVAFDPCRNVVNYENNFSRLLKSQFKGDVQ